MIDPLVRVASTSDDVALDALETAARASLTGQRGGDRWLQEHPPRSWARDTTVTWVAHVDDVVVGYLVLEVDDAEVVRVESVFVTPEARELGFGDALLDAARTEAVRRGAAYLEGEALPGDRDTKNLYERAGITARLITVSTRLTPATGPSATGPSTGAGASR